MAKGRKLTTSRSERYLDAYGYNNQSQGTSNGAAAEFEEDEVWSMIDDSAGSGGHSTNGEWNSRAFPESNGSYPNRRPPPHTDRRQNHRQVGGLSLAFDDPTNSSSPRIVHQLRAQDSVAESRQMATSAPVNVPDWSKIYRVDSVESLHDSDDGFSNYDSELVPPHEYLAREYARSEKSAANSVFEGVGRTLKGRDLSRVRDAVWSQTGFDG